jgi:hypothetical protein
MQEMAGETSDLRYVVAGLFNAVPEVFASLDPERLKGIGFVPHRKRSEVRIPPSADILRMRVQMSEWSLSTLPVCVYTCIIHIDRDLKGNDNVVPDEGRIVDTTAALSAG